MSYSYLLDLKVLRGIGFHTVSPVFFDAQFCFPPLESAAEHSISVHTKAVHSVLNYTGRLGANIGFMMPPQNRNSQISVKHIHYRDW